MTQTRRKDGTLSAYGFACGYVQTNKKHYTDDGAVYMYLEHNTYHVRVFGTGRGKWDSFPIWEGDALNQARKRYAELCKYPDGYNGYNSWDDWNAVLWITNDETKYRWIREYYKEQIAKQRERRICSTDPQPIMIERAKERTAKHFYGGLYKNQRTPDGARYTLGRVRLAVEQIADE